MSLPKYPITCQICNKETFVNSFSQHLKKHHISPDDYEVKYGSYRGLTPKPIYYRDPSTYSKNRDVFICSICNLPMSVSGIAQHFKGHNITKEEYKEKYGEYCKTGVVDSLKERGNHCLLCN